MKATALRVYDPANLSPHEPAFVPTEDEAALIKVFRGMKLTLREACEYLAAGAFGHLDETPAGAMVPIRPKRGG